MPFQKSIAALAIFILSIQCCALAQTKPDASQETASDGGPLVYRVDFDGEVNKDSVNAAIDAIGQANQKGAKAIVIFINSPGGSVDQGIRLSNAIEDSDARVVCVVRGMAASMAAYLLQSCSVRIMYKSSQLMFHEPSLQTEGKKGQMRQAYELLQNLTFAMAEHESARLNISLRTFMRKTANHDWWLTYREALNVHAIDYAVTNKAELVALLKTLV